MAKRAVFLDRDGTVIREKEYLSDPDLVELIPGVMDGLAALQSAGYLLVLVTNQSGVGRGYFTLDAVHAVHARMAADLKRGGVVLDAIYIAPEAPGAPSRGRKPSPQFLFDARDAFGIDLSESYMVGDKLIDLECGWNAGVARSILVRSGYGAALEKDHPGWLDRAVVVDGVAEASAWILSEKSLSSVC